MVCREVLNSRAMALILTPDLIRSNTTCFCSSFNTGGRPKIVSRSWLLLHRNECVQVKVSSKFSDHKAICIIIFLLDWLAVNALNAKQCTRYLFYQLFQLPLPISIALQPAGAIRVLLNHRSPLQASKQIVETRDYRCHEPPMCSDWFAEGLIFKPALSILALILFEVVRSSVDIRQKAKIET